MPSIMNTETLLKYYAPNNIFRIANPNPAAAGKRGVRWDRDDCAIRALCNSTGCSWLESFDWLTARARRDYNVLNDAGGVRKWLTEAGCPWTPCKAVKGHKRMTCLDFANNHPKGRYFLRVANHFTACVDGVLLDTWNPFEYAVVGYFDMANFDINK